MIKQITINTKQEVISIKMYQVNQIQFISSQFTHGFDQQKERRDSENDLFSTHR